MASPGVVARHVRVGSNERDPGRRLGQRPSEVGTRRGAEMRYVRLVGWTATLVLCVRLAAAGSLAEGDTEQRGPGWAALRQIQDA